MLEMMTTLRGVVNDSNKQGKGGVKSNMPTIGEDLANGAAGRVESDSELYRCRPRDPRSQ